MVKYLVLLLFPLSISAQELSQERIDDLQYHADLNKAGFFIAAASLYTNFTFSALEMNRIESNYVSASFAIIGVGIMIITAKKANQYKKYNEFKNSSKIYGRR